MMCAALQKRTISARPITKPESTLFKAEHLGMIPPSSSDCLKMRGGARPGLKRLGVLGTGKLRHIKGTLHTVQLRRVSTASKETRQRPSSGGELTL